MNTTFLATPDKLRAQALPLLTPERLPGAGRTSLSERVQAVLRTVPDHEFRSSGLLTAGRGLPPHALLAVLVFCYASEIFSAQEIARLCQANAACRAVGGGHLPFPAELRAFRQRNRTLIERCLLAVLRAIEQQKAENQLQAPAPEEWLTEDARRRILTAACCDSIELDDATR